MKYPLTIEQCRLLHALRRRRSNFLRNSDEQTPKWWISNGPKVSAPAAKGLLLRGLITPVDHVGGHPGVFTFKLTDAGRVAAYRPHPANSKGGVS